MWNPNNISIAVGVIPVFLGTVVRINPVSVGSWAVSVIATALIMWSLLKGYRKWDEDSNILHYFPVLVGVFLVGSQIMDVPWIFQYGRSALIAGVAHPLLISRLGKYSNIYCDGIVGACLIGGLYHTSN